MDLFIYSDESGVFDKAHNEFFVFAWIIFFGKEEKDNADRLYANAEKPLQSKYNTELKGCVLRNRDKGKLFRSLNRYHKGAVVVHQRRLLDSVFSDKKTKQRYLDYAIKIGIKKHINHLIREGLLTTEDIQSIHLFADEHTTATNGRYELKEGLLQELKYGTHNWNYSYFFPPLLPKMQGLDVCFCDSEKIRLIRCADIIANRVYFRAFDGSLDQIANKVFISHLP